MEDDRLKEIVAVARMAKAKGNKSVDLFAKWFNETLTESERDYLKKRLENKIGEVKDLTMDFIKTV